MERPRRLAPGDRVAIVAPAGPVREEDFAAGLEQLRKRYQLVYDEDILRRTGYLAGDDARRRGELEKALSDRSVRAVLCARGGYGVMRLLPSLRLAALAKRPKPVIGFSDITVLHAAVANVGVVSVHGPVVTQIGRLGDKLAKQLARILEDPTPPAPWRRLKPVVGGRATGRLVGGNLEMVSRLVGTPWLPPLDGALLVLEEVSETPYRIDRALTHLELAGVLDKVKGVIVGDLVDCEAKQPRRPTAIEVVRERLSRLKVPLVTGAPIGHGKRNHPFPHGGRARLDADDGSVTFLEGAVS